MTKDISFKFWRVGKATELLNCSVPVAWLFDMDEWKAKSSAIRYADEDAIDQVKLMQVAIDNSDDENGMDDKKEEKVNGEKRRFIQCEMNMSSIVV